MVAILAGSALSAVGPLVVRSAVDALRARASWDAIGRYSILIVVIALVGGVFRYLQRRLVHGVSRDVETDVRDALFARLVRQPPVFFDDFPTGDVLSRFTNDLSAVRMAIGPGILFGVNTLVTLVMAVALMVSIDPTLAAWALLPLPLVSIAVQRVGRRVHRRSEAAQAALADLTTAVQENLAGARVVRAHGRADEEGAAFAGTSARVVEENLGLARLRAFLGPFVSFLMGASLLVVLFVGAGRVAGGAITLGDFVAFTMYLAMIGWPLVAVGWITNLVQRASAAMGRLNRVLLAEPAIDDRGADPAARPESGAVEFREVTFRHRLGPAVLDRLSLAVPAGTVLGVTGPTGGGKSTLVHLLVRLHEPEAGAVLLDGRPVADYPLAVLRAAVSVAPQEPFLFGATLRANVAYGAGGDAAGVEEAGAVAGLATDVAGFPAGWDTVIGERGVTLSGGQKQRAALARALLAEPLVLVLDDAFSAVDAETEERILARLRGRLAGRTAIVVSHRASTLRHADRIVVLDRGRIVEAGTHAELVEAGGWYAALDRRQRLEAEVERA